MVKEIWICKSQAFFLFKLAMYPAHFMNGKKRKLALTTLVCCSFQHGAHPVPGSWRSHHKCSCTASVIDPYFLQTLCLHICEKEKTHYIAFSWNICIANHFLANIPNRTIIIIPKG